MPKYYIPYQYKTDGGSIGKCSYITPLMTEMTETKLSECLEEIRNSPFGKAYHVDEIFIYGFFPLAEDEVLYIK